MKIGGRVVDGTVAGAWRTVDGVITKMADVGEGVLDGAEGVITRMRSGSSNTDLTQGLTNSPARTSSNPERPGGLQRHYRKM